MQDTEGLINATTGEAESRANILGPTEDSTGIRVTVPVGFDITAQEEVERTIELTPAQAQHLLEKLVFVKAGYSGSKSIIEDVVNGKYDSP